MTRNIRVVLMPVKAGINSQSPQFPKVISSDPTKSANHLSTEQTVLPSIHLSFHQPSLLKRDTGVCNLPTMAVVVGGEVG